MLHLLPITYTFVHTVDVETNPRGDDGTTAVAIGASAATGPRKRHRKRSRPTKHRDHSRMATHNAMREGGVARASRHGPAQARRAYSEEANSVVRGGPPAAAHITHAPRAEAGRCVWISLSPHHPAQVRCCVVNSVARGGRTRARRVTLRKSGLLAPGTRTCLCVDVRAHVEVGWWRISLLPGAPCAPYARARAEDDTRAAGRNDAPRHRARRFAHAPLLPRATCGRAMAHVRARCSPPPSPLTVRKAT